MHKQGWSDSNNVFITLFWKGCIIHKWCWGKRVESGFLQSCWHGAGAAGHGAGRVANPSWVPSSTVPLLHNLGPASPQAFSSPVYPSQRIFCVGGTGWTDKDSKQRLLIHTDKMFSIPMQGFVVFFPHVAWNICLILMGDWQRKKEFVSPLCAFH